MAIPTPTFKRALLALSFACIIQSAAAKAAPIERNFDTIRDFHSYDPATKKWSEIEDFETIDILDDATEQREDHFIYHGFWAYDAVKKRWRKVDIRDHGYKRKPQAAATSKKRRQVIEETPQASFNFFKNLTLGIKVGGGGTFHINRLGGFEVIEKKGAYFLNDPLQTTQEAHKIQWPGTHYTCYNDLATDDSDTKEVSDKTMVLKGAGWNIPLTAFTHYTLFKAIRLGGGAMLGLNYLKKLRLKGKTPGLKALEIEEENRWFFNTAFFGLLGIKVFHAPRHDLFLDLQTGRAYNLGNNLSRWLEEETYIQKGWLAGVGVTYEHKLNNYFKFITHLGANWIIQDDTPKTEGTESLFVELHQIAAHIDLGIQVNFGKDVDYETDYEADIDN